MTRKALGKGLAALIQDSEDEAPGGPQVSEIALDAIDPNPDQPRRHFNPEAMQELADSIREHGVVQPVIVTREAGRFRLVVGERRWRAARTAGLKSIPVLVRELSAVEQMELALVENLQREDLNPKEEALAFQQLINEYGWTQEQVALRVGKSRPAVANSLRLLKLSAEMQKDLEDGTLSAGHARAILSLDHKAQQGQLWRLIRTRELSVRQAERLAQRIKDGGLGVSRPTPVPDPDWLMVEEELQRALGARVRIARRGRNQGRIEIFYSSKDDLERLLEILQEHRHEARPRAMSVSLL